MLRLLPATSLEDGLALAVSGGTAVGVFCSSLGQLSSVAPARYGAFVLVQSLVVVSLLIPSVVGLLRRGRLGPTAALLTFLLTVAGVLTSTLYMPSTLLRAVSSISLASITFGSVALTATSATTTVLTASVVGQVILVSGLGWSRADATAFITALAFATLGPVVISRTLLRRLQAHNARMKHDAFTDPLTGLFNRRGMLARAAEIFPTIDNKHAQTMKTSETVGVALLLVDIDYFKKVNDTYGHEIGDDVIRAVATAMQAWARESDVVVRLGGEEFTTLLPATSAACAEALAERLRATVANHAVPGLPTVSVSIGVAHHDGAFSAEEPRSEELIRAMLAEADRALYEAKSAGRNRIYFSATQNFATY